MRERSLLIVNWRDTTNPEGGGSERYVEEVATGLAARGWSVSVLCAGYPGSPREAHRRGVRYLYRGGKLTVYAHGLWQAFKHRRHQVVDVQNGLPFFTRLVRRQVVVLLHHVHREQWPVVYPGWPGRLGWWLESRLSPWLYRDCRYVTVSSASRDELVRIGVAAGRINVVHNGTEPAPPRQRPRATTPTVLCVGRLVPHKQVEHAIDAIALARTTMADARLVVVGAGWWEERLREYAERLGVSDAVEFRGYVSEADKHAAYDEGWLLALPSLKEGWGIVVGEAAAHSVPTVAYRSAGGPTESVHDGAGVLADDHAGFCAAVVELLGDDVRRRALSSGAMRSADTFTWGGTVAAFERVLDGLPAAEQPAAGEPVAEVG
ncbi:MAG TPA: glycosyltransferase family 4 protein [Kribbellaceae bacterium]